MNIINYPRIGETVYERVMDNGCTVRVIKRPGYSKYYAFFATDYGAIDTKFKLDGQWMTSPMGVAHYLEHKMFDTEEGNALQELSVAGASPNAFTSYDITAYYFESTDNFEKCLRILLSFVSVPYFTEDSVEKERGIIGQEIGMYLDSPDAQVMERLFEIMYDNHPVKVSVIGTVDSIAEITAKTLYNCHKAFYDPSNMTLCVVGDLDPEDVFRIAEQVLPPKSSDVSERDFGQAEPEAVTTHRTERKMEVGTAMFMAGFKLKPMQKGREAFKMLLLADLAYEVLMGPSSPLYARMYSEGLINSSFSGGAEQLKGASLLIAGGESNDPDRVVGEIIEEAGNIAKRGVDVRLFARLKKAAYGKKVASLDNFETIAYSQASCHFMGGEFFEFPEIYDEITPSSVRDFIVENITAEKSALSVITPNEKTDIA